MAAQLIDDSIIKRQAQQLGWTVLLIRAGLPEDLFTRGGKRCPWCGGDDRFSYSDRFGRGDSFCRHCGHHDGIDLVRLFFDCDYPQALQVIADTLDDVSTHAEIKSQDNWALQRKRDQLRQSNDIKRALKIIADSAPVSPGDPVDLYLRGRGIELDKFPPALLFHNCLHYWHRDEKTGKTFEGEFPAMIGVIKNGSWVNGIQRTWIKGGARAPVPEARKVLGKKHGAIQLFGDSDYPPGSFDAIGLGEGIETVLSYQILLKRDHDIDIPVFSCIDAGGLEKLSREGFQLPEQVKNVHLIIDKDRTKTGANKAKPLEKWLRAQGKTVYWQEPRMRRKRGQKSVDWNDVLKDIQVGQAK